MPLSTVRALREVPDFRYWIVGEPISFMGCDVVQSVDEVMWARAVYSNGERLLTVKPSTHALILAEMERIDEMKEWSR
jgi:hypothetical protein